MYSPPYVNPSFARACRHYECIGSCGGGRSKSVPRSSRPAELAAAQQRAEQLSMQQRLIRAALDRAAPLTAPARRDTRWTERAGQSSAGRQDRMLVADARRAAELLRRQEQEQEWRGERQRQEREWERQEQEWYRREQELQERERMARRSVTRRRRQATPTWGEEERYYY